MKNRPYPGSLGVTHRLLQSFLMRFGCRLVDAVEIAERIELARGGRDWPGMAKWQADEGPRWANDAATAVFEVPLANVAGFLGLAFAQELWMSQPSVFEYVELGETVVVRLWWDESRGAFPYAIAKKISDTGGLDDQRGQDCGSERREIAFEIRVRDGDRTPGYQG